MTLTTQIPSTYALNISKQQNLRVLRVSSEAPGRMQNTSKPIHHALLGFSQVNEYPLQTRRTIPQDFRKISNRNLSYLKQHLLTFGNEEITRSKNTPINTLPEGQSLQDSIREIMGVTSPSSISKENHYSSIQIWLNYRKQLDQNLSLHPILSFFSDKVNLNDASIGGVCTNHAMFLREKLAALGYKSFLVVKRIQQFDGGSTPDHTALAVKIKDGRSIIHTLLIDPFNSFSHFYNPGEKKMGLQVNLWVKRREFTQVVETH